MLDPEPEEGRGQAIHYLGHLDGLNPHSDGFARISLFWRRLWKGSGEIDEALDTVGIGGFDYLHVSSLSAGQKRRVALARLLIHARPVWLLDEPATSLDASGEAMLGRLVEGHLAGGGMAMAAPPPPAAGRADPSRSPMGRAA